MKTVRILHSSTGQDGRVISALWDGSRYGAPIALDTPGHLTADEVVTQLQKQAASERWAPENPEGTRAQFEEWWLSEKERLDKEFELSNRVVAVLDSGVLTHHPLLAPILEPGFVVDLTGGNDPEDHNGHGTMCALIATRDSPNVRLRMAKIVDNDGQGEPSHLISGLRWLTDMQASEEDGIWANISVGQYSSTRWGRSCRGDCEVCRAALDCARAGVRLFCASGNTPGRVACPASAAYYKLDMIEREGIVFLGVGSYNFAGGLSHHEGVTGQFAVAPIEA